MIKRASPRAARANWYASLMNHSFMVQRDRPMGDATLRVAGVRIATVGSASLAMTKGIR